jgi:NAD(P)H-dependent FMN reductase
MNIEIIAGSPRKESISIRLAKFLQKYLNENTDHEVHIIDVRDWELPPLQHVYQSVDKALESLKPLAARMFAANAFILVTPEYNGSYTPGLKNLFDHFPKQVHKTFAIATSSPGALGGIRAALQLQLLTNALFGIGSPHMLVTPFVDKKFDAEGNLTDADFQKSVDVFVSEFLWLAESLAPEMQPVV